MFRYVTHPKQLAATKAAEAAGKAKVTKTPSAGLPSCFAYQPGVRRFCVCSGGSGGGRRVRRRLGEGGYDRESAAGDREMPTAAAAAAEAAWAAGEGGLFGDDHEGDDGSTMRSVVRKMEGGEDEEEETATADKAARETAAAEKTAEETVAPHEVLSETNIITEPLVSAAAAGHHPSSSFSLVLTLVACIACIWGSDAATTRVTTSGSLIVLVSCLVLAADFPSANAHNWVPTPGRSWGGASTTAPCKGRTVTDTHQQIGPGQTFIVGFQTGHGSKHYLIVVHGDNEHWLGHPKLLKYVTDRWLCEWSKE